MKKHDDNYMSYSKESARVDTTVVKAQRDPDAPAPKSKKRKKKKFHVYVAILFVWLIAVTCVIIYGYRKFNSFLIEYEASYQSSDPQIIMNEVFAHFESRDIEFIWQNMPEHPTVSQFESEDVIKTYMLSMIEGKTLTYVESGEYTAERPCYAIEADGYVVSTVALAKVGQNEYGNPIWGLSNISFPVLPLEGAMITLPSNASVYINGIQLDDTYITEVTPPDEDELQYVEPYGGSIPGFTTYAISGLYYEPTVEVKDYSGAVIPVEYNAEFDRYNANYSSNHPEREALEQYGIEFTTLFANVISTDAQLEELDPYFPDGSVAYDYISRNTALRYFTGHGAVTIQNEQVQEFIAYNENTVYMQVYIEQEMQMWPDPEVVPTTTHIYLTKINGEWQISGMRY
ncbi:MAG: hypothetical protein J6127_01515 [Clostridiales bacterium]|nr:hypothetical protein [Clostridiales bacterium]